MDERNRLLKVLLLILIGFVLLLYCLGAVSLWARNRFLGHEILSTLPTLLLSALPFEGIF